MATDSRRNEIVVQSGLERSIRNCVKQTELDLPERNDQVEIGLLKAPNRATLRRNGMLTIGIGAEAPTTPLAGASWEFEQVRA